MKRKILYFILIMLTVSLVFITGCGDLSKLAGSTTVVEQSEDLNDEDQLFIEESEQERAEEESKLNSTVWITKTGKCYHIEGCYYLKSMYDSMTQKEAIDKGFEPCSKCITSYWLPQYWYDKNQ